MVVSRQSVSECFSMQNIRLNSKAMQSKLFCVGCTKSNMRYLSQVTCNKYLWSIHWVPSPWRLPITCSHDKTHSFVFCPSRKLTWLSTAYKIHNVLYINMVSASLQLVVSMQQPCTLHRFPSNSIICFLTVQHVWKLKTVESR